MFVSLDDTSLFAGAPAAPLFNGLNDNALDDDDDDDNSADLLEIIAYVWVGWCDKIVVGFIYIYIYK